MSITIPKTIVISSLSPPRVKYRDTTIICGHNIVIPSLFMAIPSRRNIVILSIEWKTIMILTLWCPKILWCYFQRETSWQNIVIITCKYCDFSHYRGHNNMIYCILSAKYINTKCFIIIKGSILKCDTNVALSRYYQEKIYYHYHEDKNIMIGAWSKGQDCDTIATAWAKYRDTQNRTVAVSSTTLEADAAASPVPACSAVFRPRDRSQTSSPAAGPGLPGAVGSWRHWSFPRKWRSPASCSAPPSPWWPAEWRTLMRLDGT